MKPIDTRAISESLPPTNAMSAAAPYVGPAMVTSIQQKGIEVELPDGGRHAAELALALDYTPIVGDTLLTIKGQQGYYVIGVLAGQGRVSLRAGGDIDIRSETGSVRVNAAKSVALDAPELSLRARALRTFASSGVERANEWVRSVRDTLSLQAGQCHTVIEGTNHVQANDHNLVAREKVRVNGKAIHLG